MVEPNNGQPLSQPDRPKPSRHNAKRLPVAKLQAIIYALGNNESICSITRDLHVSRHEVLSIRNQHVQEIQAARERIKAAIEAHYFELAHEAMDKIGWLIQAERSPLKLLKIYDKLTDHVMALEAPVQTQNPQPLSIKLAALRRAKRNELSVPSD